MRQTTQLSIAILASAVSGFSSDLPDENSLLLTVLSNTFTRAELAPATPPSAETLQRMEKYYPDGVPKNWKECHQLGELPMRITHPLIQKFAADQDFSITDEEIEEFFQRSQVGLIAPDGSTKTHELSAEDKTVYNEQATYALKNWKYNMAMYETYGGSVIDTGLGVSPSDAILAYVKECESVGLFSIHDPEIQSLFWICMTNTPGNYLSPDEGVRRLYEHPADALKRATLKRLNRNSNHFR